MTFKLRSGNKPLFKKIGASPVKDEVYNTHQAKDTDVDPVFYGKTYDTIEVKGETPPLMGKTYDTVEVVEKKVKKKEPKKKIKKKVKKQDTSGFQAGLVAALKKQHELNRRRERKEEREKYIKKTKSIINLLDKPGL